MGSSRSRVPSLEAGLHLLRRRQHRIQSPAKILPVLLAFDDDDKTETYAATARPQVHGIWRTGARG
jgi:hypothetical protein